MAPKKQAFTQKFWGTNKENSDMGVFTVQNAEKYVKRIKKADAKTATVNFFQSFRYQSHYVIVGPICMIWTSYPELEMTML